MMGKILLIWLSLINVLVEATSMSIDQADKVSTYIVHVAYTHAAPLVDTTTSNLSHAHYNSFLHAILPSSINEPSPRIIYSNSHAATGFAARMTKHQALHIAGHPGVLTIYRDKRVELHTTSSPGFLHLSPYSELVESLARGTRAVIVVLDSGVYPKDRRSFTAYPTLPPPPLTFRGGCVSTNTFNAAAYCNNKLVRMKYFYNGHNYLGHTDIASPLDTNGHGTHTASIAAGSAVRGANLFGYADGTAKGMSVGAHIATYKVCWTSNGGKPGCFYTDILAGMDEADVISISIGREERELYHEPISIGAFKAMEKGIIVSTSAGNNGPDKSTANNLAPWLITVGASSIDRQFPAHVVLGRLTTPVVDALCWSKQADSFMPLIYGGDAGYNSCESGKLSHNKVVGKIVLCDGGYAPKQEAAVHQAGGLGTIVPSTVARLEFLGTVISKSPSAPRVAAFSGRGPNCFAPEIVKPDIIAPGVDILAAWSGENSPSSLSIDTRRVEFNIISGMSMACPHVSGIAAMLKVVHPSWSPAAIKSAIMTTAYGVDNRSNTIKSARRRPVGDLNYPAFSVVFGRSGGRVTQRRSLTNVGANTNAVYNVTYFEPPGTTLVVTPSTLTFNAENKTLDYTITLSGGAANSTKYQWGAIDWNDGKHKVRNPVVATWN
uniref:Subtilisin-like protease n=1 Tax=Leersia perrieri TaxID=77586 RepID=A0A0D9XHK8_9ORYZ